MKKPWEDANTMARLIRRAGTSHTARVVSGDLKVNCNVGDIWALMNGTLYHRGEHVPLEGSMLQVSYGDRHWDTIWDDRPKRVMGLTREEFRAELEKEGYSVIRVWEDAGVCCRPSKSSVAIVGVLQAIFDDDRGKSESMSDTLLSVALANNSNGTIKVLWTIQETIPF